jgi:copper chaperone CopZ
MSPEAARPGRNDRFRTNAPEALARGAGAEKLQVKIGGMSCSFCVASITKAMQRIEGVRRVGVNLAHEEALIEYEPQKVSPIQLRQR